MVSKVSDYPKFPIEYPLGESLLIYGKRLAILFSDRYRVQPCNGYSTDLSKIMNCGIIY